MVKHTENVDNATRTYEMREIQPVSHIIANSFKSKILQMTNKNHQIPLEFVDWSKRWCTVPAGSKQHYENFYETELREDDVFVVTFPKSGTTWIQEALWLLTNALDFEKAKTEDLHSQRSLFLEFKCLHPDTIKDPLTKSQEMTSPRLLKSHMPAHLLPRQLWEKKNKIIYCARNPKDVIVSLYHFQRGLGTLQASLDEFVEDFINSEMSYTPFWSHVLDFWQLRQEPNVFFTSYEEMQRNLSQVLVKLNDFLGKPPLTETDLSNLLNHLNFQNMRSNQTVNLSKALAHSTKPLRFNVQSEFRFIRRGIVGSYKDELSIESQNKLDKWTEEYLGRFNLNLSDIFDSL
uniref:Sulfotransferase domain-containing protein n=1 Tax=Glossina brevipalpis TaxID=37001 RepID=A0A1A9WEK7_9MUSC